MSRLAHASDATSPRRRRPLVEPGCVAHREGRKRGRRKCEQEGTAAATGSFTSTETQRDQPTTEFPAPTDWQPACGPPRRYCRTNGVTGWGCPGKPLARSGSPGITRHHPEWYLDGRWVRGSHRRGTRCPPPGRSSVDGRQRRRGLAEARPLLNRHFVGGGGRI